MSGEEKTFLRTPGRVPPWNPMGMMTARGPLRRGWLLVAHPRDAMIINAVRRGVGSLYTQWGMAVGPDPDTGREVVCIMGYMTDTGSLASETGHGPAHQALSDSVSGLIETVNKWERCAPTILHQEPDGSVRLEIRVTLESVEAGLPHRMRRGKLAAWAFLCVSLGLAWQKTYFTYLYKGEPFYLVSVLLFAGAVFDFTKRLALAGRFWHKRPNRR